jgi:Family of unknown function (DUF6526)
MSTRTQTFDTHSRYNPIYHFVAAPILYGNFLLQTWELARTPSRDTLASFAVALGLAALTLAARTMALSVQDRVIRLEERLRLERLLPPERRSEISALSVRQLVALRFASDAEAPALVARVVSGELADQKAIKQAVREWRPDFLRA